MSDEPKPVHDPDPVGWFEAARDTITGAQGKSLTLPPVDLAVIAALIGIGEALLEQNAILADLAERPGLNSLVRRPPITGAESPPR